jgi:hypothetical protein
MFAIHDRVPLLSAIRDNERVAQGFLGGHYLKRGRRNVRRHAPYLDEPLRSKPVGGFERSLELDAFQPMDWLYSPEVSRIKRRLNLHRVELSERDMFVVPLPGK